MRKIPQPCDDCRYLYTNSITGEYSCCVEETEIGNKDCAEFELWYRIDQINNRRRQFGLAVKKIDERVYHKALELIDNPEQPLTECNNCGMIIAGSCSCQKKK